MELSCTPPEVARIGLTRWLLLRPGLEGGYRGVWVEVNKGGV